MSRFEIVSSFLIIIVASTAAGLECGVNEVEDKCPRNCPYDYCPKDELQDRLPCEVPADCPPPLCKCSFNYRRADNGTCIPTTDCPPFECPDVNEVYDSCPSFCPSQRCSDASLSDECPFLSLLVLNCSPACRCRPHHWRDEGVCVPYSECPNIKAQLNEQPAGQASISR